MGDSIRDVVSMVPSIACLGLSPHTVDETLDRLRRRTGLHTTPQLAAWAAQEGWLRVEPVEHDE